MDALHEQMYEALIEMRSVYPCGCYGSDQNWHSKQCPHSKANAAIAAYEQAKALAEHDCTTCRFVTLDIDDEPCAACVCDSADRSKWQAKAQEGRSEITAQMNVLWVPKEKK